MRTVKLIFIFILCVGNVVLLFNADAIFGETDRVGIFTEVLKDTIKSDGFYRTGEVEEIVEKYNELKKQAEKAKKAEEAIENAEEAAKRAEEAAERAEAAETFTETESEAKAALEALSTIEDIARQFPSDAVNNAKERAEAAVERANASVKDANEAIGRI